VNSYALQPVISATKKSSASLRKATAGVILRGCNRVGKAIIRFDAGLPIRSKNVGLFGKEARKKRREVLLWEEERKKPRGMEGNVDYDDVMVLMVRWGKTSCKTKKVDGVSVQEIVVPEVPAAMKLLEATFRTYCFNVEHLLLEGQEASRAFAGAIAKLIANKTQKSLVVI
jgi:hypothetical protein